MIIIRMKNVGARMLARTGMPVPTRYSIIAGLLEVFRRLFCHKGSN